VAAAAGGVAVLAASGSGRESTAPASAVVWMVAVALLGPLLARPFTWLIGSPLSAISRGPGLLARANTGANLRRVASVATPLMLAVSLVCTLYFGKTMLEQQTTKQTSARTTADYVLGAGTSAGLPADITVAARRVPGVAQASGSFATTVIVAADGTNLNKYPARAVDAATLAGVLDLGISAGSLADLRGASLAVSTDRARQFGWRAGERVDVMLGDGTPIALRVAATYARPLGFADILLPRALAVPHVTQALDDAVFVAGRPGADRRALVDGLERLRRADPDLAVTTRAHYEHALARAAHKQALAVYALLGLIVVFCALAAVNAVMMSTAERAREFALLRLVGAGKRQIGTMIRAETLIMVSFGLAVGSLIALPGLALFSRELTGSAVPSGPFWIYGALVSFFAALAFAASSVSTRLALRMDPVKAMAARQ
jgi:putative ABC transport system permease protein